LIAVFGLDPIFLANVSSCMRKPKVVPKFVRDGGELTPVRQNVPPESKIVP
jgi:hypothetical protein